MDVSWLEACATGKARANEADFPRPKNDVCFFDFLGCLNMIKERDKKNGSREMTAKEVFGQTGRKIAPNSAKAAHGRQQVSYNPANDSLHNAGTAKEISRALRKAGTFVSLPSQKPGVWIYRKSCSTWSSLSLPKVRSCPGAEELNALSWSRPTAQPVPLQAPAAAAPAEPVPLADAEPQLGWRLRGLFGKCKKRKAFTKRIFQHHK